MRIILSIVFSLIVGSLQNPVDFGDDKILHDLTLEVPLWEKTNLTCLSVDDEHNFHYWEVLSSGDMIGPYYHFDNSKYDYRVLSGDLIILNATKNEEGIYTCASLGVHSNDIKVSSVLLKVTGDWEELFEHDEKVNSFRIVLAICSVIVVLSFVYTAYRIYKDRYMYPKYLDEINEEDENSGDETYRPPATSTLVRHPAEKKKEDRLNDFETPLISTDFISILDTSNI